MRNKHTGDGVCEIQGVPRVSAQTSTDERKSDSKHKIKNFVFLFEILDSKLPNYVFFLFLILCLKSLFLSPVEVCVKLSGHSVCARVRDGGYSQRNQKVLLGRFRYL